jgi:hypothetical protein
MAMADIILKSTTREMKISVLAGLFGLFAGLCAVFAALATLSDRHNETEQARWPVASAAVVQADIVISTRAQKDDGGRLWKLRVRMSFQADAETRAATLYSRPVYSESEAASLHSWAAQHHRGTHIDLRYDPSQPDRAVFAAPEPGFASEQTRTDLMLLTIAAAACAGLLRLARFLRAREASAAHAADDPERGMLGFGSLFAAMGLMITAMSVYGAVHADPFTADRLMGVPAGLMFVFAGILLALPPQYAKWRGLLATLIVTCFAVTLDRVAFGPGERRSPAISAASGSSPARQLGEPSSACSQSHSIFAQ